MKALLLEGAALVGLTALTGWLRVRDLGTWSLWLDEALTADRVTRLFSLPKNHWTPTQLAISMCVTRWGLSETALRFVPMLVGVLTIPVLHPLQRRITSPATSLLALTFLALSPWHLFWSQSARSYTTVMLLFGAGGILAGAPPGNRFSARVAGTILLCLAGFERRFIFAQAIGVLTTVVALHVFRERRAPIKALAPILILVVGVLAYDALARSSNALTLLMELERARASGPHTNPIALLRRVVHLTDPALFALGVIGSVHATIRPKRHELLILALAGVPLATTLSLSTVAPTFPRYGFSMLPGVTLLAASALVAALRHSRATIRAIGTVLLVVTLASVIDGNVRYFATHGQRENWRAACATLADRALPSDRVFVRWPLITRHYLPPTLDLRDLDHVPIPEHLSLHGVTSWVLIEKTDLNSKEGCWLRSHGTVIETHNSPKLQLFRCGE